MIMIVPVFLYGYLQVVEYGGEYFFFYVWNCFKLLKDVIFHSDRHALNGNHLSKLRSTFIQYIHGIGWKSTQTQNLMSLRLKWVSAHEDPSHGWIQEICSLQCILFWDVEQQKDSSIRYSVEQSEW